MEVQQAQAFLAVVEELHFGRAAARLQMGQPPLSRMIQKLERQLGAELFRRSSRSVSITTAGQALIKPAQDLVEASDRAIEAVQSTLSGYKGKVRLGFAGASSNKSVGQLAAALRTGQTGIKMKVQSAQFSHDSLAKVLDRSLDFGIGLWGYLPSEVTSMVIGLDEVLIALPANHPLASRTSIYMKELAQESWVNLPGGFTSALQNRFKALTAAAGFVPRTNEQVPDSYTAMVLVAVGMGCSLSLRSVSENAPIDGVSFAQVADDNNPPLQLRLIWRKDTDNPAVEHVVRVAEHLFRNK